MYSAVVFLYAKDICGAAERGCLAGPQAPDGHGERKAPGGLSP